MVPSLFGTRDQIPQGQFFHRLGLGYMVSGFFPDSSEGISPLAVGAQCQTPTPCSPLPTWLPPLTPPVPGSSGFLEGPSWPSARLFRVLTSHSQSFPSNSEDLSVYPWEAAVARPPTPFAAGLTVMSQRPCTSRPACKSPDAAMTEHLGRTY